MRKVFLLLLIFTYILVSVSPARAQNTILIYYAGSEGGLSQSLQLPGNSFQRVPDLDQAQVLILNGVIPDPTQVADRVRQGAGLILIMGPDLSARQVEELFGGSITLTHQTEPLSLVTSAQSTDPLLKEIVWTSAPQVRERSSLSTIDSDALPANLKPLVVGFEDNSLVLGNGSLGKGQVFLFTPYLNGVNPQIQGWAYFNYFVYNLVTRAAGLAPLSFADYPDSPLPHQIERFAIIGLMAFLLVLSFTAFLFVRRYSLAHPEALDVLVKDKEKFEEREASTQWEEIGFHRPLGGFLLALMLGLVMFVPLIIYQNLILPVYILPSAQALGIWGRVVQFFNLAWQFFDMGTSVAFIKYLSQYRVHDPRKGIQYGQLFVWWQALSGAIQVALIVILASVYVPRTTYAIYAWSVIIHAMIQIPGFYQVMRHALTGLQRFDYAQILDMASGLLLLIVFQPIVVSIMYLWGKTHPVFGPSMAGLLGMGIAAYLIEAATFVIGFLLYRRLGFNTRLLFLAHFDWDVIKNSFRFGVFEMLGSIAWAAGQAAEIWITQSRLINYAEIWGNWGLAQNFIYSYQVLSTLYNNLMPSISEAISHGRKKLSQYYEVMAYKYGGLTSAFIGAVLLAVADRFIIGASGPEFVRAAEYSIPLIIWGAIQYPSWVGDNIQLAANRPYLKSTLITGEQIVRVVLAFLLLQRFQINALILSYFIGLGAKGIVAYWVNNRICFPQKFYFWQSLFAPILAGGAHYLLLRWFTGLIWKPDQVSSVLIFFIGILLSFPIFAFLYGLFGGWDKDTLHELRMAVDLSNFMRPVSWLFWAANAAGAHLSPLHGRFPIDIRDEALEEARSLTIERVSLEEVAAIE